MSILFEVSDEFSETYLKIKFINEQIEGLKMQNENKLPLEVVIPALKKERDVLRIKLSKQIEEGVETYRKYEEADNEIKKNK